MSDTDIEIVADDAATAASAEAPEAEVDGDTAFAVLEALQEEEYVDPIIAAGDGLALALQSGNTGVIQAALNAWEAAKAEDAEDDES